MAVARGFPALESHPGMNGASWHEFQLRYMHGETTAGASFLVPAGHPGAASHPGVNVSAQVPPLGSSWAALFAAAAEPAACAALAVLAAVEERGWEGDRVFDWLACAA